MNTKEAIEFVESIKWEGEDAVKRALKAFELIDLLRRGEKFEQIVEDMRKILKPLNGMTITYTAGDFLKTINNIKQKYFPKE